MIFLAQLNILGKQSMMIMIPLQFGTSNYGREIWGRILDSYISSQSAPVYGHFRAWIFAHFYSIHFLYC